MQVSDLISLVGLIILSAYGLVKIPREIKKVRKNSEGNYSEGAQKVMSIYYGLALLIAIFPMIFCLSRLLELWVKTS